MVQFTHSHTTTNNVTNEIKVWLEKPVGVAPYIHQSAIVMDARQALQLIDELKTAIKSITESK